jgi:hypothetical protein
VIVDNGDSQAYLLEFRTGDISLTRHKHPVGTSHFGEELLYVTEKIEIILCIRSGLYAP